ncbi:hypothetical protein LBMAG42_46840 [Deltaproteobacteria bacterium]|nr:hypothetical protein LBMAG42_46840 [Deltaproteobacteria bacterium]
MVSAGIRDLPRLGTIEATRFTHDGEGAPYIAEVSSARVMLPGRREPLWIAVYRCADHAEPMVLLTTHPCDTVEELGTCWPGPLPLFTRA